MKKPKDSVNGSEISGKYHDFDVVSQDRDLHDMIINPNQEEIEIMRRFGWVREEEHDAAQH